MMYVGELANRTCKRHQIDLSPRTYYGRKIPTHFSLHDCLKSLQSWTRFANITTCPIRPFLGRFGCGVGMWDIVLYMLTSLRIPAARKANERAKALSHSSKS